MSQPRPRSFSTGTSCPQKQHAPIFKTASDPVKINRKDATEKRPNGAVINSSRYKTELCRAYQDSGTCKYGDKCQFAHGTHELRALPRHPKYKTELCRTFHSTGYCPYGPRCHFVHKPEERRTVESNQMLNDVQTRDRRRNGNIAGATMWGADSSPPPSPFSDAMMASPSRVGNTVVDRIVVDDDSVFDFHSTKGESVAGSPTKEEVWNEQHAFVFEVPDQPPVQAPERFGSAWSLGSANSLDDAVSSHFLNMYSLYGAVPAIAM